MDFMDSDVLTVFVTYAETVKPVLGKKHVFGVGLAVT
jgi:hypothetical protein